MTKDLAPKISNFEQSRLSGTSSKNILNVKEIVRWMAPEILKHEPYTFSCEIFSKNKAAYQRTETSYLMTILSWEQEPSFRLSWAHIYPRFVDLKSNVPKDHFIKYNPLNTKKRERQRSVTEERNIQIKPIQFEKLTNMERLDEKTYIAKKALNEETGNFVVCKEFDNKDDEFMRELNILSDLKGNTNIIDFIGISE
ncbi:25788_t:CDS:2, partial [Racocetra persica]